MTYARLIGILLLAALSLGEVLAQPAPRPVRLGTTYIGDVFANLAGGHRREAVYLDQVSVALTVRAEPLVGWQGGTLFLYGLGGQGGRPSRLVGDAQGVSNIEAPGTWMLYEAWIQQIVLEDRLSLLAGLYDLNTEFDVMRTASLFLNSSHGIGIDFAQSGRNGPSIFPATSAGVRLKALPWDALYVQAAVLDGVPGDPARTGGTRIRFDDGDGLLLVGEIAFLAEAEPEAVPLISRRRRARHRRISRVEDPPYRGKLAAGVWHYTAFSDDLVLGPAQKHRSRGAYLLAEWDVFREARQPEQGLSVFGRGGVAEARVNRFASYTGAGFVYTGLLPRRAEDQLGLALAWARNGSPFREARLQRGQPVDAAELNVEFTYLALLTGWLGVQADLQYVINPDTDPGTADALALGLRLQAWH